MKIKRARGMVILVLSVVYLSLCLINRIEVKALDHEEENMNMLYYLLNADGMKGLGHTAIFVVDQNGNGRFYSYNGMQYNLQDSLMGKAGVGFMYTADLSGEETIKFLETGDIYDGLSLETENYDWALYRHISEMGMEKIEEAASIYIEAGNKYKEISGYLSSEDDEAKKEELQKGLDEFCQSGIPLYQIYKANCDMAARTLIAATDRWTEAYYKEQQRLTPIGTFKTIMRQQADIWGVKKLGVDSWNEKTLGFLMIF